MARIRHISFGADDPAQTAEFYKNHMGLTELSRRPADTGHDAVFLSDGYIYVAVLRNGTTGDGAPVTPGLDHVGFYVDSLDDAAAALGRDNVQGVQLKSAGIRRFV